METSLLSVLVLLFGAMFVFFMLYLDKRNSLNSTKDTIKDLNNDVAEQYNALISLRAELNDKNKEIYSLKELSSRTESQKKSSEVRLGLMAENFMPFIRDYPYDHKNFRFLANPVDGIQVNEDSIIFIEFKTGGAKLSQSQKHIKNLVKEGRVRFETFRVDENGSKLKLESEMTLNEKEA